MAKIGNVDVCQVVIFRLFEIEPFKEDNEKEELQCQSKDYEEVSKSSHTLLSYNVIVIGLTLDLFMHKLSLKGEKVCIQVKYGGRESVYHEKNGNHLVAWILFSISKAQKYKDNPVNEAA